MSKRYFGSIEIKDDELEKVVGKIEEARTLLNDVLFYTRDLISFTVDPAANTDGGEAANNQKADH